MPGVERCSYGRLGDRHAAPVPDAKATCATTEPACPHPRARRGASATRSPPASAPGNEAGFAESLRSVFA